MSAGEKMKGARKNYIKNGGKGLKNASFWVMNSKPTELLSLFVTNTFYYPLPIATLVQDYSFKLRSSGSPSVKVLDIG